VYGDRTLKYLGRLYLAEYLKDKQTKRGQTNRGVVKKVFNGNDVVKELG